MTDICAFDIADAARFTLQYLVEQLPESVRETSSQRMAFSDLTALTPQQLDDVCKWLLSRVVMFSGDMIAPHLI